MLLPVVPVPRAEDFRGPVDDGEELRAFPPEDDRPPVLSQCQPDQQVRLAAAGRAAVVDDVRFGLKRKRLRPGLWNPYRLLRRKDPVHLGHLRGGEETQHGRQFGDLCRCAVHAFASAARFAAVSINRRNRFALSRSLNCIGDPPGPDTSALEGA